MGSSNSAGLTSLREYPAYPATESRQSGAKIATFVNLASGEAHTESQEIEFFELCGVECFLVGKPERMAAELSLCTVREMKEELSSMGVSFSECVERKDIEAKLLKARAVRGGRPSGTVSSDTCAKAQEGGGGGSISQANPFASMALGLQSVFDSVGGNCKGVVSILATAGFRVLLHSIQISTLPSTLAPAAHPSFPRWTS